MGDKSKEKRVRGETDDSGTRKQKYEDEKQQVGRQKQSERDSNSSFYSFWFHQGLKLPGLLVSVSAAVF